MTFSLTWHLACYLVCAGPFSHSSPACKGWRAVVRARVAPERRHKLPEGEGLHSGGSWGSSSDSPCCSVYSPCHSSLHSDKAQAPTFLATHSTYSGHLALHLSAHCFLLSILKTNDPISRLFLITHLFNSVTVVLWGSKKEGVDRSSCTLFELEVESSSGIQLFLILLQNGQFF